jgi:hypothetical protein
MNQLVAAPIEGEILPPSDLVSVFGTTHPLHAVAAARIQCRVVAGLSIKEILDEALRDKPAVRLEDLIVYIGDCEVPRDWWPKVRVKKGAVLTFSPRLAGGGPVIRTVLGLAITVAAVIAAPYLVPEAITICGVTVTASIAQAVVALGIVPCGAIEFGLYERGDGERHV